MPRREDEADAVGRVGEKRGSRRSRPEDATLVHGSEIVREAYLVSDRANHSLAFVRVEIVDNEDPPGVWIGGQGGFDVLDEVLVRAAFSESRSNQSARRHF